jgi:hypothetical protein
MSALTKLVSSPKTIASIKAIHKIVKTHILYGRVWTDKRLTPSKTTVHDHRIKYEYCNPTASQLDSINKVLRWKGLRAKRYLSNEKFYGMHPVRTKCLVIEHI